ncbi:MAG: carboxypeptidase-like regulatory domain-containing protein, partial [Cyclobacteriaceae bacterium]|nr:carboxypeptidase-like regulatory domain-containing protein [Cyclobacteriaceae bacterium]
MNHIYQYIMKQVPGSTWLQRKWVVMLLLSTVVTMAMAQQRTVTGKVTDATDGLELPGVNVFVKGTTNGTATDFNGNYSITVDAGDVLVYSFVGYTVQEVAVGAQSIINLALELNLEQLQEVVVVGYGAVQKKDLTGVVAAVKSEDFNKGIITSPTELLTGKVAGVSITTSGGIGNAPQVRIRGISSLSASSDPLYVIDGVIIDNDGLPGQRNPMNFINSED